MQLRKLWSEEQYVPDIPLDEIPDLNCCLLYQQLQVINCCISRKRRHVIATESLDSVIREAGSNIEEPFVSKGLVDEKSILYARISTGELVLRLGAGRPSDNLMMLETGEPIYVPVTQVWLIHHAKQQFPFLENCLLLPSFDLCASVQL